jgi:hypothetical protein
MENNRLPIVPPSDISDFYNALLKKNLEFVSMCDDELPRNRLLILKMNRALNKIFKETRHWLEQYDFDEEIKRFGLINNQIMNLKPFRSVNKLDEESQESVQSVQTTSDYNKFHKLVEEKECLIWKCLGNLGILGRLREGSEERVA